MAPSLGAMILGISSLGTILEIVRGLVEPAAGLRSKESPTMSSSVYRPVPARVSLLVAWGNGGRASSRLLVLLSVGRAGACVPGRDSRNLPH
jgi:hypothetical protein